jgi:hypothetical protein
MAVLTGTPLFVLGFMGMWLFSALDAWRTAQMIRSGVTPDTADDILVSRFSGNPKLWGIVLAVLGGAFLLQRLFDFRFLFRALLPILLIGLGIYILRGYIFKPKPAADRWRDFNGDVSNSFVTAISDRRYQQANFEQQTNYSDRSRSGAWRDR